MPKGIYDFFGDLESLAGVEAVNSGRFIPRNKVNGFEANIQFYDEVRRIFRLRVAYKGFVSYPEIRVSPEAKDEVEEYIRNYEPGRNKSTPLQETSYELNQTAMVGV